MGNDEIADQRKPDTLAVVVFVRFVILVVFGISVFRVRSRGFGMQSHLSGNPRWKFHLAGHQRRLAFTAQNVGGYLTHGLARRVTAARVRAHRCPIDLQEPVALGEHEQGAEFTGTGSLNVPHASPSNSPM